MALKLTSTPELSPVTANQIPSQAAGYFFKKSRLFVQTDGLRPDDFDQLLASTHDNSITSYVAQQDKTYSTNGDTERIFHIVDCSADGDIIGGGEVRYALTNNDPYFKDKPFVGWIHTEPEHRGLRRRNLLGRLLVMKTVAESILGLPLYSDTLLTRDSSPVVNRLIKAGLAEKILDTDGYRVRSVPPTSR